MAGEVYKYNYDTQKSYATNQQAKESFFKENAVSAEQTGIFAKQTTILTTHQTPPQLDTLLGVVQKKTWVKFKEPFNFDQQRSSSSYIVSSLGSNQNVASLVAKLDILQKQHPEDTSIRTMKEMLEKGIMQTNQLVDLTLAGIHQFKPA